MKWNLNYIQKNAKPSFTFNENIEFDNELIKKINGLDGIENLNVSGKLKYLNSIEQVMIDYEIKGTMKVRCAITNDLIDYKFCDSESLCFTFTNSYENDDIIYVKGNTIELVPFVWQLIVVNVPLRVIKEGAKLQNLEGKNWKIGDFDDKKDTKEENIDPRLQSLKNYFDKQ